MNALITFMNRLFIFLALSVLCLSAQAAPRPNILYLYADDLGWGSLNANTGSETLTKTPAIDSLVSAGLNFRQAYGCMVCSPARSTQQTGFHQGHTWTDRNDTDAYKKAMRVD
ncbi:MAG: sulfatase-like hydrolase/transferase, partial [Rhodospirillaceae bacterium]|nr:sulfatase-like hydrolase/transferase [Rhodospirillaceae bacterium]